MKRDRSLDIGKGLAILFVYLGHSVLYHPIRMNDIPWCLVLSRFITSFHMPLFFLISGYLFSKTTKNNKDLYKGKTLRLLIPYLFTMAIIIAMKLILPQQWSYNSSVKGGISSMVTNFLLYGGDRWFVYSLYIIFLLLIPIRNILKKKWFDFGLMAVLIAVFYLGSMPNIFTLDKVFHFMVFFVAGFTLNEYYLRIKQWSLKYWWLVCLVFLVCNLGLIQFFHDILFMYRIVLPFIGSLAVMTMASQMEKVIENNKIVQYIEYCGKYSLQFYLFTFAYPVIRTVIVSVMHITNPFVILTSVFILQLVTTTIIVEITRRIKWLKIPCGY